MPAYRCVKCKRLVVKPEGIYYCQECGGNYIMIKEYLPFLESAKKFYADGITRCPKCGSFNVKRLEDKFWCWSCDYEFAEELVKDPDEAYSNKEFEQLKRRYKHLQIIETGRSKYGTPMAIVQVVERALPTYGLYAVMYKHPTSKQWASAFRSMKFETVKKAFESYKERGIY